MKKLNAAQRIQQGMYENEMQVLNFFRLCPGQMPGQSRIAFHNAVDRLEEAGKLLFLKSTWRNGRYIENGYTVAKYARPVTKAVL